MAIALMRVDDRLVHGQVVEGWLPSLGVDLIVVVSDAAAADPVQASLMKMAMPPSVGLLVVSVADAPDALSSPKMAARRALVLVPGPAEALSLLKRGVAVQRVNVGGLHFTTSAMSSCGTPKPAMARTMRRWSSVGAKGLRPVIRERRVGLVR